MEHVGYLEISDFDKNGNVLVGQGKPVVVMGQGSFCGYCKQASPAYEKAAKLLGTDKVLMCSVLMDGDKNEREASKFFTKWNPNHRGVPAYFGFDRRGKFVRMHEGGRDMESVMSFAKSLK